MMRKKNTQGGLVYSTDKGRHCPACRQALAACSCNKAAPAVGDGTVRVRRESKGRGGKTVTCISGVPLTGAELAALAAALKKRCGCGGTLKDGVIEIQGEHVEAVSGRKNLAAKLMTDGLQGLKTIELEGL